MVARFRILSSLAPATLLGVAAAFAGATVNPLHAEPLQSSNAPDFVYPGESKEAARYNERWGSFMSHLPQVTGANEAMMGKLEWMLGSWTAQVRDFPDNMMDPSAAEVGSATPATVTWTPGKRWIRIALRPQPWNAEWSYYLGYDAVARRWVLQNVLTPSLVFSGPLTSPGWKANKITFGPVASSYRGFREVQRISIVRSSDQSFRIVNEVRMPSGRFVAMDDAIFRRTASTQPP